MEELFLCAGLGCIGIEWLRRDFVALFQKYLNFTFGGFELRATVVGKLHTFFKQCKGLLKRNISSFQLIHYFLEPL